MRYLEHIFQQIPIFQGFESSMKEFLYGASACWLLNSLLCAEFFALSQAGDSSGETMEMAVSLVGQDINVSKTARLSAYLLDSRYLVIDYLSFKLTWLNEIFLLQLLTLSSIDTGKKNDWICNTTPLNRELQYNLGSVFSRFIDQSSNTDMNMKTTITSQWSKKIEQSAFLSAILWF